MCQRRWPAANGGQGGAEVFEHFTDSGMMRDTIKCRSNGAVYDTTWVLERGGYIAHHRMSPLDYAKKNATYRADGWTLASAYRCGNVVAAIWRK